jgi:hypothetical protein
MSTIDYTKFLTSKKQLQKLYNNRAKEEREIIYAVIIKSDRDKDEIQKPSNLTSEFQKSKSNIDMNNYFSFSNYQSNTSTINIDGDLIFITSSKKEYYIEIIHIENSPEIKFKFCQNIKMLFKLTIKNPEQILLKLGQKELEITFLNETNLKEFVWSLIHVVSKKNSETQSLFKGINYKDLEDFADKNKFHAFNKIFEEDKKKERYEVDISDKELDDLRSTLRSLKIDSIINYDLESLNSKIEEFNVSTKESFLNTLQGEFASNVKQFLGELENSEFNIIRMNEGLDKDLLSINNIWHGIQKIEDANHNIELRNENKRKLHEYMTKLYDQLTISQSKEINLTNCRYISNSELIIVDEVLGNFVKFYKSRKKQDIKMSIIKEGQEKIKHIIELMIRNFNTNMYDYIKTHQFVETFLLKNLPSFRSAKISEYLVLIEKSKRGRSYLNNFILDRRFFIEKLNSLLMNQEELNKSQIFSDCVTNLANGMRDNLAIEFNFGIKLLQFFFESNLLNPEVLDVYLTSEHLLKYDPFQNLENDHIYECNKYLTTFILNSFFASDSCVEILQKFFFVEPIFFLEKNSKLLEEVEKIVTDKIYKYLSKNFENSIKKNILLGFVIYSILSAIQEKLSKNIIEDMIRIGIVDILENSNNETYLLGDDSRIYDAKNENLSNISMNQTRKYVNLNLDDVGISKISLQETKNFIVKNMKNLQTILNSFIIEQKEIIDTYTVEVRRVGIIPIVKKTCNFLKLLFALTSGIKQDYIYEICEDFRAKLKQTIERLSKTKPKYTNIVLLENYHYFHKFLKNMENFGYINEKMSQMEEKSYQLFIKYKEDYLKEIFQYQFKEFDAFYEKFNAQYELLKDQVKLQSNFVFGTFDKMALTFLKELPKEIDRMAKRVNKHMCKEEGLAPRIWEDVTKYLTKILKNLQEVYISCYNKQIEVKFYNAAMSSIEYYNFMAIYKTR